MSSTLPPRPTSPHLRLHCVNVFVRDQDRSLHFFVDQLGFNIAYDTRVQSGERWVGVAPPDGAAILSLIAPKPDSEQYKLIGRATQIVFVTEDVTTKFQEWSRRGVRFQTPPRLKAHPLQISGRETRSRGSRKSRCRCQRSEQNWHAPRRRNSHLGRNRSPLSRYRRQFLLARQLRRAVPRHGSATPHRRRKTGSRAPRRPRTRNRQERPIPPVPANSAASRHCRLRRRLQPSPSSRRRLLRLP